MSQDDALLDAITGLLPPILGGLDVLGYVGRHLHPGRLTELLVEPPKYREPIVQALSAFNAVSWPEHLDEFSAALSQAGQEVVEGLGKLEAATQTSNPMMAAYGALRFAARANEQLYPLAATLPPLSRFFLEPDARQDEALLAKLEMADASQDDVGVMHAANTGRERGGFSLYVPEYYGGEAMPLVVALHGGSGHGRGFLWSWLRAARAQGAIVISPTSKEATWSLMGPDIDTENLLNMLDHVRKYWSVDESKLLLTGMSDGGTFSYVSGLLPDSPFTHLAPVSASFHPMLLEMVEPDRIQGLPIYLTHGALDWMFPVDVARTAASALRAAGADVTYREIADLSHTYPSEESASIAQWLVRD